MPAKGGAFFGFAIIVAAALVTWGIIAIVNEVEDNDSSDSSSRSIESTELQEMLNDASPGDTIYIPEGTHEVGLTTTVSGTEDAPITITCAGDSRDDCILKGNGNARVLEILHSWYIIEEFTIDGQESNDEYKEQLIFVQGTGEPTSVDGVETALTGITIQGMTLRNAGKECIRIRYFVTNSVVDENLIGPCGIEDFVTDVNGNSNGEGVYIGTALNQIDDKGDEYPRVDECSGIVVMNNVISTQGSEGVDIKEGSYGNVVYRNQISGQMDVNAGGVSLRGDENYVYYNRMSYGEGACIRIGGDTPDSEDVDDGEAVDYGQNNEVYQNEFNQCRYASIKVNEGPQTICENVVIETTNEADDELYAIVRGDAASLFPYADIIGDCSPEPTPIHDMIRVGTRFDFPLIGDGPNSYYSYYDRDPVDDTVEEDDDTGTGSIFDDGEYLGTNTYVYRGCYFTNSQFPGEMFDALPLDGDADLSVEKCIVACVSRSYVFAGIQNGSQCWCGDLDDFTQYGTGMCNIACTGSDDTACGGELAFSLYQIYGDGGVDDGEQGDDDGGMGSDETNLSTPSPVISETTSDAEYVSVVDDDDAVTGSVEEMDDDDQVAVEPAGDFVGCYRDNDTNPILEFLYEDEDDLTPASCIESCRAEGEELAGVQNGSQCWCGTTDEYDTYGTTTCNIACSGDPSQTCGGTGANSIWVVD